MKKTTLVAGIIGFLLATLGSYKTIAQEVAPPPPPAPPAAVAPAPPAPPAPPKETQELVIRQKGDKDTKLTVEISGDKVIVNGKPLAEFNQDGVTINSRRMIIRDGNKITMDLDGKMLDLNEKMKELKGMKDFDFSFNDNGESSHAGKAYTFLGVQTEKADKGVTVTDITKGSPAQKAGLQENDVIYKIDDKKIETTSDLSETIRPKKDGDKVTVYFYRDGKKKDVRATLATQKTVEVRRFSYSSPDGSVKSFSFPERPERPEVPELPESPEMPQTFSFNDNGGQVFLNHREKLGIKIQDTEDATGVKVLSVDTDSPAAKAGLAANDVITSIAGKSITTTDEAREALRANSNSARYDIRAKRNGTEMTFNVSIPKPLKTTEL